jgi:hypothetical protein
VGSHFFFAAAMTGSFFNPWSARGRYDGSRKEAATASREYVQDTKKRKVITLFNTNK